MRWRVFDFLLNGRTVRLNFKKEDGCDIYFRGKSCVYKCIFLCAAS